MNDVKVLIFIPSTNRDKLEHTAAESIRVHDDTITGKDWSKYFYIEEPRRGEIKRPWTDYVQYVLVEDCTEEGLKLFGLMDEDEVKDYLGENNPN